MERESINYQRTTCSFWRIFPQALISASASNRLRRSKITAFHTIAVPHEDILASRLTMDVFAADLWQVY